LKFNPKLYGILFIFQNVTKATEAISCIILFQFYKELPGLPGDSTCHPSVGNSQ
jgi:hypothetical protein